MKTEKFENLVEELKSLNSEIGSYAYYIFGIKHVNDLDTINVSQLVKAAGLTESMQKEIGKAKRVADLIKSNKYGISFLEQSKEDKKFTKEELVRILADLYTDKDIKVSSAGGIFTFAYGRHVVDVYSPTELMEAANKLNSDVKTRYAAELNGAFLMYRYFRDHPEMFEYTQADMLSLVLSGYKGRLNKKCRISELPLQKIVYGAPGTGKSYGTDGIIHATYEKGSTEEKEHVFRTTFHPDTDYSTFVGCYKPTKKSFVVVSCDNGNLTIAELVEILKKKLENKGKDTDYDVYVTFGFDYHVSLSKQNNYREILRLVKDKKTNNFSEHSIIKASARIADTLSKEKQSKIDNITYDFVPQSFTKAYIKAWEEKLLAKKKDEEQKARLTPTENNKTKEIETKPIFLVIEEINRGNCAQIFGDLFQLLDREDDGMSCYPIKPDTDLGNYISGELRKFAQEHNIDIDATGYKEIINGEEMLLPDNLYIWATMNTSDQSLFPIDSAFKRRWDWEYVPISKGFDRENKKDIEYKIKIGDYDCDWWKFLKAINKKIGDTTKSEDKKLGFYFCKADNKIIDAKKFVGKVIFYLWNDVFKDYETDLFDNLVEEQENPTFEMFYNSENGETKINEDVVKKFIKNVCSDLFSKDKPDNNPDREQA